MLTTEMNSAFQVWFGKRAKAILNLTEDDLQRFWAHSTEEVMKLERFIFAEASSNEARAQLPSIAFVASKLHTESEIVEQETYLSDEDMAAVRAKHLLSKIQAGIDVDAGDTITALQQQSIHEHEDDVDQSITHPADDETEVDAQPDVSSAGVEAVNGNSGNVSNTDAAEVVNSNEATDTIVEDKIVTAPEGTSNLLPDEIEVPGYMLCADGRYLKAAVWADVTRKLIKVTVGELHEAAFHQCFYFLRNDPNPISVHTPPENMEYVLSRAFEFAQYFGTGLELLEHVVSSVFCPVLAHSLKSCNENPSAQSDKTTEVKAEFFSNIQKFSSQLGQAFAQSKGGQKSTLQTIQFPENSDDDSYLTDPEFVEQCEGLLQTWIAMMAENIESQQNKHPLGKGPLAELEFWRERSNSLSTLCEQLTSKDSIKTIKTFEAINSSHFANFESELKELNKMWVEAKENDKFLSTLERHFKIITQGTMFQIAEAINPLLNGIRMVWVISRHYNNDERMVPLMERIANEIAVNVSQDVNVRYVFKDDPATAMNKINSAITVLSRWRETYFKVREKIEQSGRDQRWEFDRKRLFDRTDYMSKRCENIHEVAEVLLQFQNILGPELKAVTGDSRAIDESLTRVNSLTVAFETVPFDIFDRRFQASWESVMHRFREDVSKIEEVVKSFINDSFKKLRNADGAFALLEKFKSLQSRQSITQQMAEKYTDVLFRFRSEIEVVLAQFDSQKSNPPISRNLPFVAGSISWARSLFLRIKKTMTRFNLKEEQHRFPEANEVVEFYIKVGKTVRSYEQHLFTTWCEKMDETIIDYLKSPLLKETRVTSGIKGLVVKHIDVNFPEKLSLIIREASYLDKLGFALPTSALNAALQQGKFMKQCDALKELAERFNSAIFGLKHEEFQLLSLRIQSLIKSISRGMSPLNWNSLGIDQFVQDSLRAVAEFVSVIKQVQKNCAIIEGVVSDIQAATLFDENVILVGVMDLAEMFEAIQTARDNVLQDLVHQYRTITPILGKIEETVLGTNTGKAAHMAQFYSVWERRIFDALSMCTVNAMEVFRSRLVARDRPLFRITATLSIPDIVMLPALTEIHKLLLKLIKNTIESTRSFLRWKRGTCLETPPQKSTTEDEEPVIHSFYSDIYRDNNVMSVMYKINQAMEKTFGTVNKVLAKWRSYEHVWKQDKGSLFDKFIKTLPSINDYENSINRYVSLQDALSKERFEFDVDFLRLSCRPLIDEIQKECSKWIQAYCKVLHDSARFKLFAAHDDIKERETSISKDPSTLTLENMKLILNVVSDVFESRSDRDFAFSDIEERYRLLAMHDYTVDGPEITMVGDIQTTRDVSGGMRQAWAELVLRCKFLVIELKPVRMRFSEFTMKQASQLLHDSIEFDARLKKEGPDAADLAMGDVAIEEGLDRLETFGSELEALRKRRQDVTEAQLLFNLEVTSFPELAKIDAIWDNYLKVYFFLKELNTKRSNWAAQLFFTELDPNNLNAGADALMKDMKLVPKETRVAVSVFPKVIDALEAFKKSVPIFQDLKNECIRDRHWKQIMDATGTTFDISPGSFTLGVVFSLNLEKIADTINDICGAAQKELAIESGLRKISDTWAAYKLDLVHYTKNEEDRGYVLRSVEDVTLLLDDNMMALQSMSASKFVAAFIEEVRNWEKKLSKIGEVTEIWMIAQRKWMYLEGIFVGNEDIRTQLPEEAKRFDRVDKSWSKLMVATQKDSTIASCCLVENRFEILTEMSTELDRCQKSLSDYLETKRCSFPRFFFISDDELLSILGTSDVTCVQEHMLKLFDNSAKLLFSRGNKIVKGLESSEGESFEFRTTVSTDGAVENWMTNIQAEMRVTLRNILKESVFLYPKQERIPWLHSNLGMNAITGSQIWWAWEVENSFSQVRKGNKYGVKDYAKVLHEQMNKLVTEVLGDLSDNARKLINAQIIIDVHARDIVDRFIRDSILDAKEFAWESQLRFSWDRADDNCYVRQCTATLLFGYEYEGLNGRLVITPLTDRCYMTLTTALSFRLGGSPAGPAGTGKTETVKDLAKALANQCVVFNCGEGLDYKAMGSIFSGLCQCGAWACFDEFNRIELEVLSVVSAQMKCIQNALMACQSRFHFEGREIAMDLRTGIFITMNPGYAGRVELPDSLKALFRPVTMIVPDLEQICEIMLFSEGFLTARVLARKMVVLYKLAREQCSKQSHYDFGMRALKAVLVMAGSLKRDPGNVNLAEIEVLMRALRDMNLPKFVFDDVPLFLGLINDLFPGINCERVLLPQLKNAADHCLLAKGYQLLNDQADKIVQLFETMAARHTSMVVGSTRGGKSVVIQILADAQTSLGKPTKLFIMNPKCQTVSEFYGVLDNQTREWTDGVYSNIYRECNKPLPPGKDEKRYFVFDGDVDALWVENMNSVMDDNKLLTLPNGERMRLNNHCRLLFETGNLIYASPATVSRCGIVFVDPKNLQYMPYINTWLAQRKGSSKESAESFFDDTLQEHLSKLFAKYCPPLINLICDAQMPNGDYIKRLSMLVPMTDLNMCTQLCTMIKSMFLSHEDPQLWANPDAVESIFIFSLVWSFGVQLIAKDQSIFDNVLKSLSGRALSSTDPAPVKMLPSSKPTLFSYCFDFKKMTYEPWESQITTFITPPGMLYSSILVPTIETVRNTFMLKWNIDVGRPVLFCGNSGTSKTVTINNLLSNMDPSKLVRLDMNFSSRTSSIDVQRNIEEVVEKRTKDTFGPPPGRKLMIFIDDLNMPKVDNYGTQQPIELLKLLIDYGGFYERGSNFKSGESTNWKNIKDTTFLTAMGPPGGARNPVNPRFVSFFSVFNIPVPSAASLKRIFSSILNSHLNAFPSELKPLSNVLTETAISLYDSIVEALPPTPTKFHYVFNLRDLSRIFEGMCLSSPEKMPSKQSMARLLRNEATRILGDRLTTSDDKKFFESTVQKLLEKSMKDCVSHAMQDPLFFGDFSTFGNDEGNESRQYEDMGGYEAVKISFEKALVLYNEKPGNKKMNLVLFENALEHLVRIHRVLRLSGAHALLVGVGGSGKQSLTKLASFVADCGNFSITLARGYGDAEFREDLKSLYNLLGPKNMKMVFLFTDAHVAQEGFLELINNMLASGMVPALFAEDEKDAMGSSVREEVMRAGLMENRENCWKFFLDRCRGNLHCVLAMSPVGELLRQRCRNFPGLVNNTVIDWFTPWPQQALVSVATSFLASEELPDDIRKEIVQHITVIHESVRSASASFEERLRRFNYVTPKNYLDFINNYKIQLTSSRKKNSDMEKRLEGGLTKLIQTAQSVDEMAEELKKKKVIVQEKTVACAELIEDIKTNSADAETKQEGAMIKQEELKDLTVKIDAQKAEAEGELAAALPALAAAAEALKNIRKEDITELKSFAKPHPLVEQCTMCVAIFKKYPDTSWKGAKVMMGDGGFLNSLLDFDKDSLTEKQVKSVTKYFNTPNFNPEQLKSISTAAAGLLVWVYAMANYYSVAVKVNPLREAVRKALMDLQKNEKDLKKIMKDIDTLKELLTTLRRKFAEAQAEKEELQAEAVKMERLLAAATKLISGLSSERDRWTLEVQALGFSREKLVGDCLMSSAFLSYLGAFNFDYRSDLMSKWVEDEKLRRIPFSNPYDATKILTDEVQINKWASEGLPSDDLSIQNGILTTSSSRYPLCIDPQMQAITWIKRKEGKQLDGKVRSMNDPDFIKHLELSVNYGFPFLFENIDEFIDPVINPVLEKNISLAGSRKFIKLGDKEVDWDDSFKLYLTTKLANPHYSPEVFGKTMVINYSVTQQGLEDQLLNVVVGFERADLEAQKNDLIQEMSQNKALLHQLEDTLLRELAYATGNILENQDLIDTLENTKAKAVDISTKLEESKKTAVEIEISRAEYRPCAKRGSIVFFVMASLSVISNMYENSLGSFLGVFHLTLQKSQPDAVVSSRVKNIIDHLTLSVYDFTCTGLFEKHKLMFSFEMWCKILKGQDSLDESLFDFFLRGDSSLDAVSIPNPYIWIDDSGWKDLVKLSSLNPAFGNIVKQIEVDCLNWKAWYDLETPENSPVPSGLESVLDEFQKCCLMRCMRPDRIPVSVQKFIIKQAGPRFVQPPILNFERVFAQSTPFAPIVFILSPGADPAYDIFQLADKVGMGGPKLKYVSLGQGQGPLAQQLLEAGVARGYWVLLQNCHLLSRWLKTLEKILETITKPHPDFRLWLTTDPSDA
jgi:dynein heavy chain